MTELERIAALVLAGGDGRRMGGEKPSRRLAGRSLIAHALAAARRHGGPCALGVRHESQALDACDAPLVLDAQNMEGPLASLAAGLAWANSIGARHLLTLPCDAPFLPHDLAPRLHGALLRGGARAALPMSATRLHPACALWNVRIHEAVGAYVALGGASLHGFAAHVGYVIEDWGAPEPDPFFNINTPADLEHARRLMSQPHLL